MWAHAGGYRCGSVAVLILAAGVVLPATARASEADLHYWDVLTVEGKELPAALGVRVERLGLFALHGGALEPIPFQIDERDSSDRLALPNGSDPTADDTPGVFDDNDLLVFSASDLGARVTPPAATEIRVHDADGNRDGWVYLRRFPTAAPRSDRDYVDYDPASDAVSGMRYSVRFGQSVPSYFAFADGKHHDGPNMLNRLHARAEAKILWGLLTFRRTEDDVHQQVVAYKDGPIRVMRRVRLRVEVGFGFQSPSIIANDAFTADAVEGPVIVRLPFSLRYLFADLDVRLFLDFSDLEGYQLWYGESGRRQVRCDEPVAGALPDTDGAQWFALSGPAGTLLHQLRVGPSLASVQRRLWYAIEPGRRPAPPMMCPGVGYQLTNWGGVERGTHELGMEMRALPLVTEEHLRRAPQPLTVAVTAVHR